MKSIISVLQDFEKLVYKILMWVILIPKTLVYVILDPLKAPEYIDEEFTQDKDSPFDEYMSPVVLLLVVAFLPALAFNFLPNFGATIASPAETEEVTGRYVQFQAQTDFKARAAESSKYVHVWDVEKIGENNKLDGLYTEEHVEGTAGVFLERVDGDTVKDQFVYKFAEPGDYYVNVLVQKVDGSRADAVIETYESSVKVTIPPLETGAVTVSSADGKIATQAEQSKAAVNFSDRLKQEETIFLALALMIPPLLFAFASRFLLDKNKLLRAPKPPEPNNGLKVRATIEVGGEKLSKETVLELQSKPAGSEPKKEEATPPAKKPVEYVSIGEETLKLSFYVQCYYFSPLSLAIWGTIYASYFFTRDVFFYQNTSLYWQTLLLPLVLCIMWFLRTEVKYFVQERQVHVGWALAIALACLALIGLGARVFFTFGDLKDLFRVWLIRLFPTAAVVLLVAFLSAWYGRRQRQNENVLGGNGAGMLAVFLLFIVVMSSIPSMVRLALPAAPSAVRQVQRTDSVPASVTQLAAATNTVVSLLPTATSLPSSTPTLVVEFSPTAVAGQATPTYVQDVSTLPATPELSAFTATPLPPLPSPTLVPDTPTPAPSPYYVEEFDNPLAGWLDFMTSGDQRMVVSGIEGGRLVVQLLQMDEKLPWYYLIRDGFSYADVHVEAVVINKGNNANGVSLICRYSEIGWYEFVISNSGLYSIYAVDNAGILNQGYNLIADGSSNAIKSGPDAVNTYTVNCQGDKLELTINGRQARLLNERNFKFAEGQIGVAVSSPQKLPVKVEFESVKVSQP